MFDFSDAYDNAKKGLLVLARQIGVRNRPSGYKRPIISSLKNCYFACDSRNSFSGSAWESRGKWK